MEVKEVVSLLEDKKALDIKVLDFHGVSSLFDYFVICTAGSDRQIQALRDAVDQAVKMNSGEIKAIEGKAESGWVLIDIYDIVVHIFSAAQREYYQLEKLWLGLELEEDV